MTDLAKEVTWEAVWDFAAIIAVIATSILITAWML
jgi:hypothetical protein